MSLYTKEQALKAYYLLTINKVDKFMGYLLINNQLHEKKYSGDRRDGDYSERDIPTSLSAMILSLQKCEVYNEYKNIFEQNKAEFKTEKFKSWLKDKMIDSK